MKVIYKVNMVLISLFFAGVISTHAQKITNGKMKGYGVTTATIEGTKQEVLIADIYGNGKMNYVAYIINGSPYGDYIFNLLSNPDLWTQDVFDVDYSNKKLLTIDGKEYYEITKFMFMSK